MLVNSTQEKFTIQVISPDSDRENKGHDHYVWKATMEAIEALGHVALDPFTTEIPDIQLIFMGVPQKYKFVRRGTFKAAWLYAKPNADLEERNLDDFNQLYTLTTCHQQVIEARLGRKSKILRVATNKIYTPATKKYRYDVAYMATAVDYRAEVVKALANAGFKVAVVGSKWTKDAERAQKRANLCLVKNPNINIIDEFWPNEKFNDFFNMAPLSIYPVADSYMENGIVPIRILDIYAGSDCLCLVRKVSTLNEAFSVLPPTYDTPQELINLVEHYLAHPEERKEKQAAIRSGLTRTYEDLVNDVINDAKVFWGQK